MLEITPEGPLVKYINLEKSLFIAGGISNCANWQGDFISLLKDTDLTCFNPRRKAFDMNDPEASRRQIEWEYKYLGLSMATAFWFPCETLCPITLFELGDQLKIMERTDGPSSKPKLRSIFVGCHPGYARKLDVEIQVGLRRKDIVVVDSLEKLAGQVIQWASGRSK